jgi:hypothetical protein
MLYPLPMYGVDQVALSDALEVAMHYLEGIGQADPYTELQDRAADAILAAWRAGVRHKIRLANCGILAIERSAPRKELLSFYPRVS